MPISKTTDLLRQVSRLERTVSAFSFEELGAEEAKALQTTFNTFKSSLEHHFYTPNDGAVAPKKMDVLKVNYKEHSQKQFLDHISREIRLPLNTIIDLTNLLTEEKLTTSQHKKVMGLQDASNTLLYRINEVLDYSKIKSGSTSLETIDFKLHALLNDVMFLCDMLIIDPHIHLSIEIENNVPQLLKGDPSKLTQILFNLLGNSIKFISKGSITLKVLVKDFTRDSCLLEFSVSDSGKGISKEKIDTALEHCSQGEDDTFIKNDGNGLGLHQTKELIERQNGSMSIRSVVGKGTTVSFCIPYTYVHNIPKKNGKPTDTIESKAILAGTEIMVFGDSELNKNLLVRQLIKWGCKVHTSMDPNSSLALLASKKIDLILVNLNMPNLNGFEISKMIRSHEEIVVNTTPIVAFNAELTEAERIVGATIGINDFLSKKFTLNAMMSVLIKNKRKQDISFDYKLILQKKMIEPKDTTTVDLNILLEDCFGELEMLNELTKLFKINALEFIGNVKIHLKTNDLKEIAFSAHKLKAGFAMLKANGMRKLIVEIETQCKANDPNQVNALYQQFLNDYPLLEQNLDNDLANLNKTKNG